MHLFFPRHAHTLFCNMHARHQATCMHVTKHEACTSPSNMHARHQSTCMHVTKQHACTSPSMRHARHQATCTSPSNMHARHQATCMHVTKHWMISHEPERAGTLEPGRAEQYQWFSPTRYITHCFPTWTLGCILVGGDLKWPDTG